MDIRERKEGIIVEGPQWKEPLEIQKIESIGESHLSIVARTLYSKEGRTFIISVKDLKDVKIRHLVTDFSGNAQDAFLAMETLRYRYASLFDPVLAMNISKVDPLPHQIHQQEPIQLHNHLDNQL